MLMLIIDHVDVVEEDNVDYDLAAADDVDDDINDD